MKTSPNSRVAFISYRRSDSDALAGRLRDRMRQALPDWTFFMDVTSIKPGIDFRVAIDAALMQSSLFLLLIGRDWLGGETNRLLLPGDLISYEIKSALDRGMRFIPVLVNDAKMPAPEKFPEEIRSAAWLTGVELRHSRFEDDFRNLVSVISGGQLPAADPLSEKVSFRRVGVTIIGVLLGIAIGLIGLVINFQTTGRAASDWIGEVGAALLLPALAVIGGTAGLLLSRRKPSQ